MVVYLWRYVIRAPPKKSSLPYTNRKHNEVHNDYKNGQI